MRRALFLGLLVVLVAALGCPKRKPRKPPPPPRVVILKPAALHALGDDKSETLVTLGKGEIVEVLKLSDKWSRVRTGAGQEGFLKREGFARRTLVAGGTGFNYTSTVADRLRKVPELDVVAVDTMSMMSGGVAAATQLARGRNVDLVVVVTGSMTGSQQLIYEVIDVVNGTVLGTGNTEAFLPLAQALAETTGDIYDIVHHGVPTPAPSPVASPGGSAAPAATERPHPNAPFPAASPTTTPLPNPNAPLPAASPSPSPAASPKKG